MAVNRHEAGDGPVDTILVRLGFVDEPKIASLLGRKYGIGFWDLSASPPLPGFLAGMFCKLSPARAAELRCCPVTADSHTLTLAMADPTDVVAVDEVRARTGFVIEPVYAFADRILEALHPRPRSAPQLPRSPRLRHKFDFVSGTDIRSFTIVEKGQTDRRLEQNPVNDLVAGILVDGTRLGATEIHLELYGAFIRVRYRVLGGLRVALQKKYGQSFCESVANRLFRILGFDGSCLGPQHGPLAIRFESGGADCQVDLEVSFVPVCTKSAWNSSRFVFHVASSVGLDETMGVPPEDAAKVRALWSGAGRGDTKQLQALLEAGADPNAADHGVTPLMIAASRGHVDALEVLLGSGADRLRSYHGRDALAMASAAGHVEVVRRLLELAGFSQQSRTKSLKVAAAAGHEHVVRDLLDTDIEGRGEALRIASWRGHVEVVRTLLEGVTLYEDEIYLALNAAVFTTSVETVELLLPHVPSGVSLEPLVDQLLRYPFGVFSCVTDAQRKAKRYATTLSALLSESGASTEALARWLAPAVHTGDPYLLSWLVNEGVDPNARPAGSESPLVAAIDRNAWGAFELLLDAGTEVCLETLDRLCDTTRAGMLVALQERATISWRIADLPRMSELAAKNGLTDFRFLLERTLGPAALDTMLVDEARRAEARGHRELVLADRQLDRLPEVLIAAMTGFESIDLSGNELATLPPAVRRLEKLQTLHLGRNRLRALPDSLGELTQLRELHLEHNDLTHWPGSVNELRTLHTLDLSDNYLETVPAEIGELRSLESLALAHNQLRSLPDVIRELTSLRALSIGSLRLQGIPIWITELSRLETLDLSRIGLRELPPFLAMLQNLRYVNLAENELSTCGVLAELPKLEVVNLSHNRLEAIPASFSRLKRLRRLDLGHNPPLHEIPKRVSRRAGLELVGITIQRTPIADFKNSAR